MSQQGRQNARTALATALRLYSTGRLARYELVAIVDDVVGLLWTAKLNPSHE